MLLKCISLAASQRMLVSQHVLQCCHKPTGLRPLFSMHQLALCVKLNTPAGFTVWSVQPRDEKRGKFASPAQRLGTTPKV